MSQESTSGMDCHELRRILGSREQVTSEAVMSQLNDHARVCLECSAFVDRLLLETIKQGEQEEGKT